MMPFIRGWQSTRDWHYPIIETLDPNFAHPPRCTVTMTGHFRPEGLQLSDLAPSSVLYIGTVHHEGGPEYAEIVSSSHCVFRILLLVSLLLDEYDFELPCWCLILRFSNEK